MAHTAFKLREDILLQSGFEGVDVNRNAEIDCVPNSLYMFLNLMLGGQQLLEYSEDDDGNYIDGDDHNESEEAVEF